PLTDPPAGWRAEPFETVDEAVRVFARRLLAQRRFDALYRPLEAALAAAHRKRARSAEAMLEELEKPSRADRYEAWGHLLMAQAISSPSPSTPPFQPSRTPSGTTAGRGGRARRGATPRRAGRASTRRPRPPAPSSAACGRSRATTPSRPSSRTRPTPSPASPVPRPWARHACRTA